MAADDTTLAALTDWMRGGRLEVATLRELREPGYARLHSDDANGFTCLFTALALPWWRAPTGALVDDDAEGATP